MDVGRRNKLASTPVAITDGEARRLRVTVDDAKIICYLDGRQVAEYAGSAARGNVGFRLYNAEALFDNLAVYSGVVEPPAEGEYAQAFRFPEETETIYNNEQTDHYREKDGGVVLAARRGSGLQRRPNRRRRRRSRLFPPIRPSPDSRITAWTGMSPAADGGCGGLYHSDTGRHVEIYAPAGTAAGWHRLGVVTATGGTAFTVDAASQGRLSPTR